MTRQDFLNSFHTQLAEVLNEAGAASDEMTPFDRTLIAKAKALDPSEVAKARVMIELADSPEAVLELSDIASRMDGQRRRRFSSFQPLAV